MSKIDQLIAVFKEVKEELSKNMNGSYAPGANMKPNATTGTSGGQGGMYRSEDMDKNMNPSPGGAQDMSMIKASENGQWHMRSSVQPIGKKNMAKLMAEKNKLKPHEAKQVGKLKDPTGEIDAEDHPSKLSNKDAMRMVKEECHADDPHHEAKEMKIANDIKSKAKKLKDMHKSDELADSIIEKLEKACSMMKEDESYVAKDGKNREANPKLRASDLGPGGKVHMIKEDAEKCDGINSEAATAKPHNKGKFKVMPMEPEKSVKHAAPSGKPYNGADKDVKKGEECSECHHDPCTCAKKSQIGHIQGNESKGNDENKAPGRGTLSV